LGTPTSTASGLLRFVEVMDLEQGAATVRLERPVRRARWADGIGPFGEVLAAASVGIVADGQIALEQVDLLPVLVDERRGRVDPGLEAQQPRATAAACLLIETPRQDLLLDAVGIAGDLLPSRAGVDLVELLVLLGDRHRGVSYASTGSGWM